MQCRRTSGMRCCRESPKWHPTCSSAPWTTSLELGLIFAAHTALAWNMVRRGEQFRSALASRDIIGQAKGTVMERFDVGAVQAFDMLKRLSQTTNSPVVDIARRLVQAGRPPR
jgi:hypothetical protein